MNFDHLSEQELVRYLDKHSTDPIVRRLVDIMLGKNNGLVTELIGAGMDVDNWEFKHDTTYYNPGEYITHLSYELQSTSDALWSAERELEEVCRELNKLKARTVIEWIDELKAALSRADYERDQARQERDAARISEDNMKSKMKVWRALTEDTSK